MSRTCLGLRLLLLALGTAGEPPEKKPVPAYTNDDLDRIAPFRDETGVSSTGPAATLATTPTREGAAGPARAEAYWRREGQRVRAHLQRSRLRIEDLQRRIAAVEEQGSRPRTGEVRSRGAAQVETWRRQIAAMEGAIRESEMDLADRARRAGALPGWLR